MIGCTFIVTRDEYRHAGRVIEILHIGRYVWEYKTINYPLETRRSTVDGGNVPPLTQDRLKPKKGNVVKLCLAVPLEE